MNLTRLQTMETRVSRQKEEISQKKSSEKKGKGGRPHVSDRRAAKAAYRYVKPDEPARYRRISAADRSCTLCYRPNISVEK
jgi:hypothetical protein